MKRFRGGLVFKAQRLLYHSILGLRIIKKMKKKAHQSIVWAYRQMHMRLHSPTSRQQVSVGRAEEYGESSHLLSGCMKPTLLLLLFLLKPRIE